MFLRLVDALHVAPLVVCEHTVNVLLQNLEIARDGVKRRPELVTETSEELCLDAIRGLSLFARAR
jgi:hypothetical protein